MYCIYLYKGEENRDKDSLQYHFRRITFVHTKKRVYKSKRMAKRRAHELSKNGFIAIVGTKRSVNKSYYPVYNFCWHSALKR